MSDIKYQNAGYALMLIIGGYFELYVQLSELLSVEIYGEWIRLVAEFTTTSLQSWQVCFELFNAYIFSVSLELFFFLVFRFPFS